MTTQRITRFFSDRALFTGLFVAGIALCAPGIGKASHYGWTHPITILGCLFGGAATLLGVQMFFRLRILPLRSDRQAIFALLGIMAVKFVLAALYPLFK